MSIIAIVGRIGVGKDEVAKIIQYLTSPCSKEGSKYRTYQQFLDNNGGYNARNFDHHYQSEWEIKKFAKKLKQIASILTGIPEYKFEDQEFKKTYLGDEWESERYDISIDNNETHRYTVREFLQILGSECLRDILHENCWVNALFADHETHYSGGLFPEQAETVCKNWIISDLRFPNEYKAVKDRNGITIRINRPLLSEDGKYIIGIDPIYPPHESETALDGFTMDYEIDNSGTIEELIEKVKIILQKEKII